MEQDYRRGVTETFLNALSRGFNLDGEVRSFWIQDSRGHGLFKELSIMSLGLKTRRARSHSSGPTSCSPVTQFSSSAAMLYRGGR